MNQLLGRNILQVDGPVIVINQPPPYKAKFRTPIKGRGLLITGLHQATQL